ncbi:putative transposase [Calothrix parasitica NIES-267]|uniref:Putative transposase n=1 Tax=Calothrix parasitica NIES-267 TaxID=1973488 RepID=A0A1Z4M0F4_9CYAN|nr:putative transposase [Calothrix parasitica NIES-267]
MVVVTTSSDTFVRSVENGKQFLEIYSPKGYPEEVKQECLDLYKKGMGFRAIEKKTGISHNTVINWVKQANL